MKIGYNEATGMGCSDLVQDLLLCEKAGFDYIEIRLDMLRKYLKGHTIQELAEFFAQSHLKPHALNALYLYPEFLSKEDDPEKQKALLEEFIFACQMGKEIGSKYLVVVPPLQRDPEGGPFIGKPEEIFAHCVRILTQLSDLAQPYEIKLCFEVVGFERSSVRNVEEADRIIRAVGRENVGFVFDAYNLYLNEGLNHFEVLQMVEPDKIFAVHINNADDVPIHERGQDKRCFCNDGVVNVAGFLQEIKKTGYEGMVSIETFRPEYWQLSPHEVVQTAFETTRECLEQNGCL